MRTIETNVYSFNELSQDAKEKAINESVLVQEYFWSDDSLSSLLAWAEAIGIEIYQYNIYWPNPAQSEIKYLDKYLDNEHIFDLDKYLTGYCMDYVLMKTWNETKDVDECIYAFLKDCSNDFEHQSTEDYASDYFDVCEFTEDGTIVN